MEPLTVTRSAHLQADADRVWAALADADGLSRWLGDRVEVAVMPGSAGTIVEHGVTRRLVVTEVAEGRRIGFTWWDEDAPEEASTVTIDLASDGDGTTVTVVETLPVGSGRAGGRPGFVIEASAADAALVGAAWSDRLASLAGRLSPVLATAGA